MTIHLRLAFGLLSLLAASLAGITAAHAQNERPVYPANAPEVSFAELDSLPDWRGIWQPFFGQVSGGEPQLIGEHKERYETLMALAEEDPSFEIMDRHSNCEPPGMPYMMTMPYSLEFLFTPGKIVVIQEAHMMVRRIFTDGRPLPETPDPTYFGDSVGHWEGDTLVVETIGTRPGQRLGRLGIVNSEDLRIVERIYLDEDNPNVMHLEFTFEDPNVLEEPWQQNYRFRRDRTWEILEYICEQNDRHPIGDDGRTIPLLPQ
jgi:hypothetical protein